MGNVQETYTRNAPVAYVGLVADNNPADKISAIAEGDVGFGLAVKWGTSKDQVIAGNGSGFSAAIGFSIRTLNQEGALADASLKYNDEDMVAILRSGYIYLNIADAASKGDLVWANDTTGETGAGTVPLGATVIDNAVLMEDVAVAPAIALCRVIPKTISNPVGP